jgi:endoglucanase
MRHKLTRRITKHAARLRKQAARLTQWAARRKKTLLGATMLAACAALAATFVIVPGVSPLRAAASSFLGTYARSDGQVVRLDQGGDTVSEGQAYGMLIAEVTGEDGPFWRIWEWTRHHLQLENGLFAFHANRAGEVISTEPASDADLLIAWALLRYRGPRAALAHREGRRVADAILAHDVAPGPGGVPVLTAGPWATGTAGSPSILDPSYWSLPALHGLARLDGRDVWHRIAEGAVSIVGQLSHGGRLLPPNWAELSPGGAVRPVPSPGGGQPQPQYGLDAQRTVVWFAASCDPRARALASRWWPLLRHRRQSRALALALDGTIVDATSVGLALVASAAAAKAAGSRTATSRLLRQAVKLQRSYPTYYGGAWAALGRALLTSRTLRTC